MSKEYHSNGAVAVAEMEARDSETNADQFGGVRPTYPYLNGNGNGNGKANGHAVGVNGHAALVLSELDRVLATAQDQPSSISLPVMNDPTMDHANEELMRRREDVEEKHRRITAWLDATGYEAVVLCRNESLAWFTSGGDFSSCAVGDQGSVMLYINRVSRSVITDNVQSARVFEEELAGLGFQLKERLWHQNPTQFVMEIGKGKKVATDNGLFGWPNEAISLRPLRLSLTRWERVNLRELGWTVAREIEATCRNFASGETEAHVAGHLSHRLIRQGVWPIDIQVAADNRLERYRQPLFKAAKIEHHAVISATGRRHGLCATATRMVSFGEPALELRRALGVAAMVSATKIFFSRPGSTIADVFKRGKRIYEKFGHPLEWEYDYPGFLTGYVPKEIPFLPESDFVIPADSAVCWGPSVLGTRSQDTVVVDARGYEDVTQPKNWPTIEVSVKGYSVVRPDFLVR